MDTVFQEALKGLIGSGVPGIILVVLIWVVYPRFNQIVDRLEAGMVNIQQALDRGTKADILRLIASAHVAPEAKELASTLLAEVNSNIPQKDGGTKQ